MKGEVLRRVGQGKTKEEFWPREEELRVKAWSQ